ncbi:MAG TPA: hypothetical protein VMW50_08425 [Dehalococcoidia bacterium]|nr:hypothetical protein [Dehalococcoidia bacterium]
MKNKKMSLLEVGERVAITDLTDCIVNVFGPDSIADPQIAKLWKEAFVAIAAVDNYLMSKIGDDYQWGDFEVKDEK